MKFRIFFLFLLCSVLFRDDLVAQSLSSDDLYADKNNKEGRTGPSVKIYDVIAAPGEILVQIDALNFTGDNGMIGAISLRIEVDTALVSFLGILNTTLSGSWIYNYNAVQNEITILYSAPIGTGYDINGKLLDLRLFYTGGFTAPIQFKTGCEITNKNLQTIPNVSFLPGSITQTEAVGTAFIEDVQCLASQSFSVPLKIQGTGLNSVNSIHLRVSYDHTKVTFTGFSPGTIANVSVNNQTDELIINWIDDINPVNLTNLTTLVNLEFIFAGQGNTSLDFETGSNVQSNGTILPMQFINGSVNQLFSLNLTATPVSGGQLTGNGNYTSGSVVTVTAIPAENFTFGYWSEGSTVISYNTEYQFIMPEQNVFLTAHFIASTYLLSLEANPENGGTVNGGGNYTPGQVIEVAAIANPNFTFTNWTLNNAVISTTPVFNFTMPAGNILLKANFTDILYPLTLVSNPEIAGNLTGNGVYIAGQQVTVNATANPGFEFTNWTKNGVVLSVLSEFTYVMPAEPVELQANFNQISFFLTMESNPEGTGILTGEGLYDPLEAVEVSATALVGFAFVNWTNNGTVVSVQPTFNFIMPAANTMLTANFELIGYTLTLTEEPESAGILCCEGYHLEGEIFPVSAMEASGFDFVNWTEDGEIISATPDFNYTMPGHPVTLVAHFNQTGHALTISVSPAGSGAVNGAGIYDEGETINLSAEPYPSYVFVNWTLNGDIVSEALQFDYLMPDFDVHFIANFSYIGFELDLLSFPTEAGQLNGAGFYDAGEQVNISAVENPGFYFLNWTLNNSIISNQPAFVYTMPPTNTLLQANFVHMEFTLDLLVMPENSGEAEGAGNYNAGEMVTIIASPSTGYEFDNWTLNGVVFGDTETFTFEMPLNDLTLTANFSLQEFDILAESNNLVFGDVTGSGIYEYGTTATLNGIANPGYYFVLWTENNEAVSYDESYSFTVNADRTLTAYFQQFSDCPEPVALGTLEISENSATLIWYPSDENSTWDLIWGIHGFDPLTDGNLISALNNNIYTLDNLQINTTYDFYVRTMCGSNLYSSWAGPEVFTTLLTEIGNITTSKNMVMFPNPCHDKLTIRFNNTLIDDTRISIIDLKGIIIYSNYDLSGNEITISTAGLKSGIYFVQATRGNNNIIEKLLIY